MRGKLIAGVLFVLGVGGMTVGLETNANYPLWAIVSVLVGANLIAASFEVLLRASTADTKRVFREHH